MKVIRSLKNRRILLKGNTRKNITQKGKFINFLRPLMATGLQLIKNVQKCTSLAKSVLVPLGVTTTASAADAAIQKENFGSRKTALTTSNEEMEEIMKIVKSLGEPG